MKTTFPLLCVVLLTLVAAPAVQAQLSQAQLDAIEEAAYQKELARLQALRAAQAAGAYDPLAAPKPPGKNATKADWINYDNAVAAWNQRTTAAQQQQAAEAARQRQLQAAAVQAEVDRRLALKEEQKRQEGKEAYQLWLQQRAVYALEVQAQAIAEMAGRK